MTSHASLFLVLTSCACAVTLFVTARAFPSDSVRSAGCNFTPICDSTGEENVPIPCEGFCDSYYFCQDGKYVLKRCQMSNFNAEKRRCQADYLNCDWFKPSTTSPGPTSNKPITPGTVTGTGSSGATTSSLPPGSSTGTLPDDGNSVCEYKARCDPTGTEKKPIPCKNYCNRYYLCVEGKATVETCPFYENFNNVTRDCRLNFRNCDWYKTFQEAGSSSTPAATTPTPASRPTGQQGSSKATTPKPTSKGAVSTLPNMVVTVFMIVFVRVFVNVAF